MVENEDVKKLVVCDFERVIDSRFAGSFLRFFFFDVLNEVYCDVCSFRLFRVMR